MNAYDYCKHIVETWPNRWTGSPGEKASGDWIERQLAHMGYETRQPRFPCPGWEYEGEELYLEGRRLDAGAQFFSVGCDVTGPLAAITPDRKGGFTGEVQGRIAILKETDTGEVDDRNSILMNLQKAGALAAIMESEYPDTYSTKMFRTPESTLPAAGVSGEVGRMLFASLGKEAHLVIRARQTQSTTSNVIGEQGPADGPVFLICAHHEAAPASPGAYDNAAGVGVFLEMAERLADVASGARLRFVAWGGHEFGVFGSKWYVENCPDEAKAVRHLLVFDGVGAKDSDPRIAVNGGERLVTQLRTYAEGRDDLVVREQAGGGGDGLYFVRAGVETVWVHATKRRPAAPDGQRVVAGGLAAPFHSPIDDMRWITREAMAREVGIGMDIVSEWIRGA
ncbi:MAG: M28 family peptidase [Candidatus Brocadiaceae bacterium]|nr:M28 family peptidase [Candidatus Brocadiaceae bacterium]